MARHSRKPKGKEINPTFYIFCEGETEEAYIKYLKIKYRLPIEIILKITGNKISERIIRNKIKSSETHSKDKIFLMYDLDVEGFTEKLNDLKNQTKAELLVSNPCFELWYILHFANQTAEISSENCIKKLKTFCPDYQKAIINDKLLSKLNENDSDALKRAKKHDLYNNPSTSLYVLIDKLEKIKNKNHNI